MTEQLPEITDLTPMQEKVFLMEQKLQEKLTPEQFLILQHTKMELREWVKANGIYGQLSLVLLGPEFLPLKNLPKD